MIIDDNEYKLLSRSVRRAMGYIDTEKLRNPFTAEAVRTTIHILQKYGSRTTEGKQSGQILSAPCSTTDAGSPEHHTQLD